MEFKCIYCDTTENLTESDVFPDVLTNARITNKCVCQKLHNSQMVDKFEGIVAEKLAFITNELDIKSKKGSQFPKYNAKYEINGIKYDVKNVHSDTDFLNRVMWSEDGKTVFGPIEKIREIAKSKTGSDVDVEMIDMNEEMITKNVKIETGVFLSTEMFRQAAKIAYEWYCARNRISGVHYEFADIIEFILEGNGNNGLVEIVTDDKLLKYISDNTSFGSHLLVAYIADDGSINVLVDMFGLIVYNVRLCNSGNSHDYNCMVAQLNLDSTREELLCKDYNDAHAKMFKKITSDGVKKETKQFQEFYVEAILQPINVNFHLFIMGLPGFIKSGIQKNVEPTKGFVPILLGNINSLLQEAVLHTKGLKRFIADKKLMNQKVKINLKGCKGKDLFLYLVIYVIGKENIEAFDISTLKQRISKTVDKDGNDEFIMDDELIKKIQSVFMKDENYSGAIINGANLIMKW